MAASTKPAQASRPPGARAALAAREPSAALPTVELEPHHVDILALALVALGVFLGGVAYLGWAGGALGDGAVRGAAVRLRRSSATPCPPRWWSAACSSYARAAPAGPAAAHRRRSA